MCKQCDQLKKTLHIAKNVIEAYKTEVCLLKEERQGFRNKILELMSKDGTDEAKS